MYTWVNLWHIHDRGVESVIDWAKLWHRFSDSAWKYSLKLQLIALRNPWLQRQSATTIKDVRLTPDDWIGHSIRMGSRPKHTNKVAFSNLYGGVAWTGLFSKYKSHIAFYCFLWTKTESDSVVRKQANYGMSIRNTNVNHVRETHNEKSRRNFILTDCIILHYNISR